MLYSSKIFSAVVCEQNHSRLWAAENDDLQHDAFNQDQSGNVIFSDFRWTTTTNTQWIITCTIWNSKCKLQNLRWLPQMFYFYYSCTKHQYNVNSTPKESGLGPSLTCYTYTVYFSSYPQALSEEEASERVVTTCKPDIHLYKTPFILQEMLLKQKNTKQGMVKQRGARVAKQLLLELSLGSKILLLKRHTNEAKWLIQSRTGPFVSFVCQAAANCSNSYWELRLSFFN